MPKKKRVLNLSASFVDSTSSDKQIDHHDENTPGLGLRVNPGGSKTFFYRYHFAGKSRRYNIGRYSKKNLTLAKARARVDELRSYVKRGGDPVGDEAREKREKKVKKMKERSFTDLANEFKEVHLKPLRKKTRDEHTRIIDNELKPALGSLPVTEVNKADILELLDKKAIKEGKATMANRIRARLHSIYEFGIQRGIVEKNPVSDIKRYKGETKRERHYTEKEIQHLWKAFGKVEEPAGSIMQMLLITGQRKTETMRMKWEDIQDDVWTIPKTIAKGKRTHHVPLSHLAMDLLDKMKQLNDGSPEYVFPSPVNPVQPIKDIKRQVTHVRKFTDEDDFGVKDFRLHDLRRTAATHMAKLKVDRTVLGKILNHKGVAGDGLVTAIYDRHDYLSEKTEALQKWAYRLESIIDTEKEVPITRIG